MSKHIQWYKANSSNDQGLIIDENTGENIAVSYKEEHAHLIAAAPTMLEACKSALECEMGSERKLKQAIAEAEGKK